MDGAVTRNVCVNARMHRRERGRIFWWGKDKNLLNHTDVCYDTL